MRRIVLAIPVALVALPVVAQTPIDRTIPARPDVRVEIANVAGEIRITAWDEPRVAICGVLGKGSRLEIDGEGGRVSVRVQAGRGGAFWSWGGRGADDTRLDLRVPRAAALDIDAVSADVQVDGLDDSRELSIEGVSGEVRVSAAVQRLNVVSISGDIEVRGRGERSVLQSVSGDIEARGLEGEIDLETVSGDARLEAGAVDRLALSTVSGSIEADVTPRGAADIRGDTMSGDLRLRVPADLSARIEAATVSGGIGSDFGTVEKQEYGSGERLRVRVGEGAARVELESFSGDLEIRRR
ncbi:MAG: DUF4097 family beta strand repeat-containing protein [Pseudomonadota bacterium]